LPPPDRDTTVRLQEQADVFIFALKRPILDDPAIRPPSLTGAKFSFGNRALTMISVWLEA